ncbi:MAG: trypsin-like peptidase domain-containing protein [Pseudomonadota bacterium]
MIKRAALFGKCRVNKSTIVERQKARKLKTKERTRIGLILLLGILVLCFFFHAIHCPWVNAAALPENISTARGGCPDLIDLIKQLSPSVVSISVERNEEPDKGASSASDLENGHAQRTGRGRVNENLRTDSLGSGFFCDKEGHIVTNGHVVDSAQKITVTLSTGKSKPARVIAVHPSVDLALIKIDSQETLEEAKIGNSSNVEVGQWVLAVGNPFGLGRTVTFGIVSGKGRFLGLGPEDNFIQTDASINPGNSGGPLFNMAGEVIGVNTAIISAGKGMGFSIPSNYIRQLIDQKNCRPNKHQGWLGVYVDDIDDVRAQSVGLSAHNGVIVDEVLGATPAFLAGIRKGDLILSANGDSIKNGRHLSSIVGATKPGDIVRMVVVRRQISLNIEVVMGKSPE